MDVQRILIVDDDSGVRRCLGEVLRSRGYAPEEAVSGEEALLRSIRKPPDLIFLDVGLTGMDGWLTLRLLRQMPATANVPVILMTAGDDVRAGVRAYLSDSVRFVMKPLRPTEILPLVAESMARRDRADSRQRASIRPRTAIRRLHRLSALLGGA